MGFLKRNIFLVMGISILLILFDIFTDWQRIGLVGFSLLLIIIPLFINNRLLRLSLQFVGTFLLILSLLLLNSIWVFMLVIILLLILFRTEQGNEFFHVRDAYIGSKGLAKEYEGVKLIQPQSDHRILLKQQSIADIYRQQENYAWDDVNLVYFAGSHIIDLGNTIIPERETTIMIRKIYGRTRIIIPHDVGLKLNCSMVSGSIIFETHRYPLTGENFRWMSPDYQIASRKVNLVISVVFGDVEVIIT